MIYIALSKEHAKRINEAVEYYLNNDNVFYKDCAKLFKVNRQTISNRIKLLGYDERTMNRHMYNINERYFETIDTEEKAYWLGFIVADGCIKKSNNISIVLSEQDVLHLEKMKLSLNSDHIITYEKISGFPSKYRPACLRFTSKKMKEDLNNKNVFNNKTLGEIPYYDINDSLIKHYIRGIVDGDGWFSISYDRRYKNKEYVYYEFGIGMGLEMLTWIKQKIFESLNIKGSEIKPYKSIFRLRYSGKNARNILHWLYDDSNIYLDRKYLKYKDICRLRE